MRNRHDERGDFGKVALVTLSTIKELKLDHVTVVAAKNEV